MNLRIFRRVPARKRGLLAVLAAAVAASTSLAVAAGAGTAASAAPVRADQAPGESTGLGSQPQLYGSVGVDINCAVIGYTAQAPTAALQANLPGSQFPPR